MGIRTHSNSKSFSNFYLAQLKFSIKCDIILKPIQNIKYPYRSDLMGIEGNVKLRNDDEYTTIVSIEDKKLDDHVNQRNKIAAKNATLPADAKLNGAEFNGELKR